jgi:serralysin
MSGTTGGYDPLTGIDWGTKIAPTDNQYIVPYYFYPAGAEVTSDGDTYTAIDWTPYQEAQAAAALQTFADVADVTFTATSDINEATFRLMAAPFPSGLPPTPTTTDLGSFGPPGTETPGLGLFNTDASSFPATGPGPLDPGGDGFNTLVHEFGHGLGLAHPHDDGGTSTIFPGVTNAQSVGQYALNQSVYTVMSYVTGWTTGPSGPTPSDDYGAAATPMAFDIAVLQEKYGANMNYHTGNDTYVLPGANTSGTGYSCIWDAGGTNTIDYGGALNATIDLRPATLQWAPGGGGYVSYLQGIYGGYTIAHGVLIQNAIGGAGNDLLQANDSGNFLDGNAGNNTVIGGAGNDTVVSTIGNDIIAPEAGQNLVLLGTGNDTVLSAGTDTVIGGSGSDTIAVDGANADLVYGNTASLTFLGGTTASTVDGGGGSLFADGGAGGGLLAGGSAGSNQLVAGSGSATIIGGGTGDALFADGTAPDLLVAGTGNETLSGVGASGANVFFGGSGADLIGGGAGNEIFVPGSGTATILGGGGADLYGFSNGFSSGGHDIVQGFSAAKGDAVTLAGYAAGEAGRALAGATIAGGNTTLTLSDATQVTFLGVTNLSAANFV